jgi:predicted AAA+ superfamily ATPase
MYRSAKTLPICTGVAVIPRQATAQLRTLAGGFPVLSITGPRQSGRTTLARACFPDVPYANLESPADRSFADQDPLGFLARFPKGGILDEIQLCPHLFSCLQVRVDEDGRMGRFVITGSQPFGLNAHIAQSVAGRVGAVILLPFSLDELAAVGRRPASIDTIRNWPSLLEASFVVRTLPPHHRNFNKRLVKSPKLYFLDPGLAASLMGITVARSTSSARRATGCTPSRPSRRSR